MSDVAHGADWWQASDGRWYPPEQRPGALPPPPPAMTAPPPGYGYTYAQPVAVASTNGLAIASMILGILWIWWIGSILALIFGYVAKKQIDESGGRQGGRGMAIAGIVLGWTGVAMLGLIVAIGVLGSSAEDSFDDVGNGIGGMNSDPSNGWCDEDRFWQDPDC